MNDNNHNSCNQEFVSQFIRWMNKNHDLASILIKLSGTALIIFAVGISVGIGIASKEIVKHYFPSKQCQLN